MTNRLGLVPLAVAALLSGHAEVAFPDVLQYHNDAARSGTYTVPGLTYARAAGLHRDSKFPADVPGEINAQPLFWRAPGGRGLIVIATEENVVAALDARTGERVWQLRLGPPVPRSDLPCGNIAPLGVTGTPVIDPERQAVYLDAMVLTEGGPQHEVFGLGLANGAVLDGWPVDIRRALGATGRQFDSRVQNQRGALAIADGAVYVPYGGHYGDCGDYHGWVVRLPLESPSRVSSFATRARGGAIWAPGGIVVADGSLFVATGNTFGARSWQDGEAVLRLSPSLERPSSARDFFAPSDWRALDARDLDLGGTNPLPLTVPGGEPSKLMLAMGKNGKAYLLDRENLGGIGGALRVMEVSRGPIRTSPALYTAGERIFVAFRASPRGCPSGQRGDLAALRVEPGSPPGLAVAWCADSHGRGSPMVTTAESGGAPIVWIAGAEGDNRLRGFRGDNGEIVFDGRGTDMGTVAHFQTPIAADGRIYVAAEGRVYAFTF
jgi:hypothetical protein